MAAATVSGLLDCQFTSGHEQATLSEGLCQQQSQQQPHRGVQPPGQFQRGVEVAYAATTASVSGPDTASRCQALGWRQNQLTSLRSGKTLQQTMLRVQHAMGECRKDQKAADERQPAQWRAMDIELRRLNHGYHKAQRQPQQHGPVQVPPHQGDALRGPSEARLGQSLGAEICRTTSKDRYSIAVARNP